MIDFDKAFDRLIGHEGGYVNDPRDPGGETNWGISKRSYPRLNIKDLTRDQAKVIYKTDFWNVVSDAHPAIKFQAFDFAVNSGIGTSIRKLQVALGVADDGHFGPLSNKALAAADLNDVLLKFAAQRLRYIAKLSTFGTYGAGWVNRVALDLEYAAEDN